MGKLRGVIPPLITPFTEEGELNEQALADLVQFLDDRVHGLFVGGSYGCGPLMSAEERMTLVEVVSQNISKDTQFIVHVGSTKVRDSVRLAKHAESSGADVVASVVPYYYRHSNDSIKLFFESLVNSVELPVYVYNNPKLTGTTLDVPFTQELANIGVAGIKDSSFDIMTLDSFMRRIKREGSAFDVVLGTEAMFLPASSLGVEAFIPGMGNAFPEICVELYDAAIEGKLDKARQLQNKVNSLRDIMYLASSTIVAVYALLRIRKVCDAYPREPFITLSSEELDLMVNKLTAIGMFD
jgi:dihydrodipicolinate synthase/N-acetylneuraminate lyase